MRYVAIRSEGNLIPYHLLDKIAAEDVPGQKPADFGLPKGRRLVDEISRVWADAQSLWGNFKRRRQSLTERDPYGTSITRTWIMSLFSDPEMLGFGLRLRPSAVIVNNVSFAVSHRNGESDDSVPVHIEGCKIDLDRRLNTKLRTSPQAMLQDFLNNSEHVLWGIVTNGLTVRLLRDSSRTSRPTYLEFDLESIFEGNRFNEFALFYRLLHRSRFPQSGKEPAQCLLEKYYQDSIEQGLRIRDKLRDGVEDALKTLGTAFLQHPANQALREKHSGSKLTPEQYHRQLLLLVYRLLFLMVAEERKLVVAQGDNAERNQRIYDDWYSITRLRDRAARIVEGSPFGDLWEGLKQTFSLFEYGADRNALGIPPLNGDLFDERRAIPDLAGTELYNHDLLLALRRLSLFKAGNSYQRVNYSALDVEELGSVYESLLDFKPVIAPGHKGLTFDLRLGMERKSTGSYYTRPELVHELIESALVPVMEDRLAEAEKATSGQDLVREQKAKEQAILSMSACDPACGSGHFLLAAARRLGKELARVRTREDEPRPEEFHLAVRDVISHCIYGVDLNPLAVDLCKLALWLEGHWIGKPLSFLDHRIRCGNSLVGILDPGIIAEGIRDDAFTAVTGDDKKVAAALKKQNKQERVSRQRGFAFDSADHSSEYAEERRQLDAVAEDTPAGVRRKAELYGGWRSGMQHAHDEAVADLWTAQFFVPFTDKPQNDVCTTKDFLAFAIDKEKRPQQMAAAQALAQQNRFFHWHLEFPEVLERGGFDAVLGNPPWEKIQVEEQAFFALHDASIATAAGITRKRMIEQLKTTDPKLFHEFQLHRRAIELIDKFIKSSGRYPLTGLGKMNTYANFSESAYGTIGKSGRAGILAPLGIATDDNNKDFFEALVQQDRLISLLGFENEEFIFPAVHHAFKFVALTFSGSTRNTAPTKFAFYCRRVADVTDNRRRYSLTRTEMNKLNPNTGTSPIFRSTVDAAINSKVYSRTGVLIDERSKNRNWDIELHRMFNPTDDSGLFKTALELERAGFQLEGNFFRKSNEEYVPIYEAKMIHQFDHRFGTYQGQTREQANQGKLPELTPDDHADPRFLPLPRTWVSENHLQEFVGPHTNRDWLLTYRDITSSVVFRTAIGAIIPLTAAVDPCRVIYFSDSASPADALCFLSCFNSLPFDYFTRQKVSGSHLAIFVLKQLPMLPRSFFTVDDIQFIVPRSAELTYTSWDLAPFAKELWQKANDSIREALVNQWQSASVSSELRGSESVKSGGVIDPFIWSEGRRAILRSELDAYYAHLYGLSRDELRYILDPADIFGDDFPSETFRVLKEREEKDLGEYRTRRLVLEAFDKLAGTNRFHGEMASRKSAFQTPASKLFVAVQ